MRCFILGLLLSISAWVCHAERTEIVLWHSMAGDLGSTVMALADKFNQAQTTYHLKPVYKGDYTESLTAFVTAYRAHRAPDLIQVFEVGSTMMLASKGVVEPIGKLFNRYNVSLPFDDFFPAVYRAYSLGKELQAMPFNVSVPVLFYNADALAKIGYTTDNFPKTFADFEVLAKKLQKAGYKCAYTSAYPAWIFIESYSALEGIEIQDRNTGEFRYNQPEMIKHLERLAGWQKKHYFEYAGRTDNATMLFTSGRCLILSQSSGSYGDLSSSVAFSLGVAPLFVEKKSVDSNLATPVGGGALWAVAGKTTQTQQGVVAFLRFWAQPKTQQYWYQQTGYLPLGIKGVYRPILATQSPILKLAINTLSGQGQTLTAMAGPFNLIRIINDEALEAIFAGIQTPKQALIEAILRAQVALQRFQRNTGINKLPNQEE